MSVNEEMKKQETQSHVGKRYESCLLCGCTTGVPLEEEIDYRAFYIEGAGQLCRECYKKLYE